jgi:hypothetical protein
MTEETDNPLQDARKAILEAISDLRAANIAVPTSLHRAAHALAYASDKPSTSAFCGQGAAGAIG